MIRTNSINEANNYNTLSSQYTSQSSQQNDNVIIPQEELDEIILSLEFTINNINKDQNKYYIIEGIENIIEKLKKYMNNMKKLNNRLNKKDFIKSNSGSISTIELKKNHFKNNYSPLKPQINNYQYSYSTNDMNSISTINYFDITNSRNGHKNFKSSSSLNSSIRVPIRKERSPETTRYNGPRVNGKKEGKGVYIYQNGCRYEGYFRNDKKEGKGIFYYKNGDRYEGNFEDGNYEGNGIFYFNNGDRYEGQFERNKYSGRGKYYYHNGDIFDGYWMEDKKTGEGTYYYKNGDKAIGKYYNGKPYGIHIKYCKDGRTLQINY